VNFGVYIISGGSLWRFSERSNRRGFFADEQKANLPKSSSMARRPEIERILSQEELREFSRRLSMLSISGIEATYRTAYAECRLEDKRIPPAAAVQQLVTAWKVLRKTRKG
jgi:hypothetical protein